MNIVGMNIGMECGYVILLNSKNWGWVLDSMKILIRNILLY